jgi:1-acyl-sn-glycerol-3-phosphate acyltransferase
MAVSRSRPSTVTDFRPAKPNRLFIRVMRLVNRFYAIPRAKLVCDARGVERLRRLPPGVIITPNHSAYTDALVVVELMRQAKRFVAFMATRETFDANHGIAGLVMQWMGGFSVNRGGENGKCQQFAKDIVKRGEYDLLIFPEGEIYLLNDLVMPFKPGVAMLALDVASENQKEGRPDRPVTIVPVAFKYLYLVDLLPVLEGVVAKLEVTLFGERRPGALYDRIYAIGVALLTRTERDLGLRPDPQADVYDRARAIREFLLETLERRYLGRVRDEYPFDRARRLIIHILEEIAALPDRLEVSPDERAQTEAGLRHDLSWAQTAARSVSFAEDYLIRSPTPERMAETLTKLEREVYGREAFPPQVRRKAIIRIGDPIDARRYLPDYGDRKTRKDAILHLVQELQTSIQSMIDSTNVDIEAGKFS